jgi:hypothetical protein
VVERRRGLVDEQHRRFGEERAGDVDALAFAAGELVRTAALLRGGQADGGQEFGRPGPGPVGAARSVAAELGIDSRTATVSAAVQAGLIRL